MTNLLIGIDRFDEIIGSSDTFDPNFISPMIVQATDLASQRILGTALTIKLRTDYNNDSLTGIYQTIYNSDECKVEYMVAWQAYVLGLPRMAIKIANGGLVRASGSQSQEAITNQDIAMLINNANATVTMYANQVKDFLSNNYNDIPELSDNTLDYLRPNLERRDTSWGLSYTPNNRFNQF